MDPNWRPAQGSNPTAAAAGGDWRAQLQPEARSNIVNKMYVRDLIDLLSPLSNHMNSILPPLFLFPHID